MGASTWRSEINSVVFNLEYLQRTSKQLSLCTQRHRVSVKVNSVNLHSCQHRLIRAFHFRAYGFANYRLLLHSSCSSKPLSWLNEVLKTCSKVNRYTAYSFICSTFTCIIGQYRSCRVIFTVPMNYFCLREPLRPHVIKKQIESNIQAVAISSYTLGSVI